MPTRQAKNALPPDWNNEFLDGHSRHTLLRVLKAATGTLHVGIRKVEVGGGLPPQNAKLNEDGSYYEPRCGHYYQASYEENWMEFNDFCRSSLKCKKCEGLITGKNKVFGDFTYEQLIPIYRVHALRLFGKRYPGVKLDDLEAVFQPMEERLWVRFRNSQWYVSKETIDKYANVAHEVVFNRLRLDTHDDLNWLKEIEIKLPNFSLMPQVKIDVVTRYHGGGPEQIKGQFVAILCAESIFRELTR